MGVTNNDDDDYDNGGGDDDDSRSVCWTIDISGCRGIYRKIV